MNRNCINALKAAILALSIGGAVDSHGYTTQPLPPAPRAPIPALPDTPSVSIPEAPDIPSVQFPREAARAPNASDSYHVMCEQGGLRFDLAGGLLYLDPDTLQITSVSEAALRKAWPEPVSADIPDRYETANCSQDGGRTWGRVVLDFYAPNFGESSVVHTGYEDALLGGQSSDESEEFPASEETSVEQFFEAMVDMLGTPPGPDDIGTPTLPTLPSPLYTIDVKYKGPAGQYVSTSVPGVFGIATPVAIVNGNGNQPETILVQIGTSQTTGTDGTVASSGYGLKIQRVVPPNVTATCNPLEADVKVRIALANPQAPGYPSNATGSIELGYKTIGFTAKSNAPSTFDIKYESATATSGPSRNDFFVAVTQVPSCTADAIDIVGHFVDRADPARADDDVDLTLDLMQKTMTDWTLARKTDASYRMMITSKSPKPLGTLTLSGQNKTKQILATVDAIPESVTACVHQGKLCNAPWRMDRKSEISFYFKSRDAADHPAQLTVHYMESSANDSLDLLLTLSDLAIDSYIGKFGWQELPGIPLVRGDYPKWFYIDTGGTTITGHYHTATSKHHFNVDMSGWNRIWSREVVADKKKWGTVIRVDLWGRISCSGFSIDMDSVPPPINGKLLGSALCR